MRIFSFLNFHFFFFFIENEKEIFFPIRIKLNFRLLTFLVQDMIALRNRIDRVDENLKEIGIEIEYQSVYRKVKITGLIWLIHWIILIGLFSNFVLKFKKRISEIIITFSYVYITNVESLALYDYDIFIQYVYQITIYQFSYFFEFFKLIFSKIAVG